MRFAFHDADGRIESTVDIPEAHDERAFQPPAGPDVVEVSDKIDPSEMRLYRVQGGQVVARDQFPGRIGNASIHANGLDKRTIRNLPKGTVISGAMERGVGTRVFDADDDLEITATEPGLYEIEIDPFPYRPFKVQIDAIDDPGPPP